MFPTDFPPQIRRKTKEPFFNLIVKTDFQSYLFTIPLDFQSRRCSSPSISGLLLHLKRDIIVSTTTRYLFNLKNSRGKYIGHNCRFSPHESLVSHYDFYKWWVRGDIVVVGY